MDEIKEENLNAKDWTFIISCILVILEILIPLNIFYSIEPPFSFTIECGEIWVKINPSKFFLVLVFIVAEVALSIIYFIPYFIALCKNHKQILPIFLLNLFGGWTLLGWLIALIWACYNYGTVETKSSNYGTNKRNKHNEKTNKD